MRQPISATDAIDYACTVLEGNATVKHLSDREDRDRLADALGQHGVHRVVPMSHKASKSRTAIALYAGDGILLKATHKTELDRNFDSRHSRDDTRIVPCVLPPLRHFDVEGFRVEAFPWIDRTNVTSADVNTMKQTLARFNLRFKPGDDKPDNLGVLPGPGHKLAVLDGDAVELLNPSFGVLSQDSRRWEKEVHARFSPLYQNAQREGYAPLVSANPDFTEQYSPLVNQKAGHVAAGGRQGGGWKR